MTQRPAAGKPLFYGDKDCNFSELFLFKSSTSASKKNINAKQIGVDQDGWLFNTYFKFTIFQFRSQCPLQELTHSLLIILSWFTINVSLMSLG